MITPEPAIHRHTPAPCPSQSGINHASPLIWRSTAAVPSLVIRAGLGVRRVSVLDRLKGRGSNGEKVGLGSIRRPVIGLALGGGAARGFAHIGILRTLLANGIVPDVVVGTSIGAVVGGLHAAGRLDTFEEWGRSLQGMRNILGYLDIRLNGSGLLGGEKLATRLEEAIGQILIEDLPIKFASVATEVRTGHEIWLTRGRVVDAMRASYALPGIFAPVLIGDRWLVDGALVNPVPVSAARALGAEIVIAANLSSDIFTHSTTIYSHGAVPAPVVPEAEEPVAKRRFPRLFSPEKTMKRQFFGGNGRPGISSVMVDAFNIMQDRITRARLAGDPPDMLITPRVGQFGWFDFHRAEDLIAHGTRAAERALESIQEAIHVLAPPPEGAAPTARE
ncbi:phospholipase [Bradyrhizobium sp. CCBAU 51765]|nr:phospholipase [Bradyrhizobium sp. CCBAU 51765]